MKTPWKFEGVNSTKCRTHGVASSRRTWAARPAESFGRAGALPAWQGESFNNSRSTARTAPQGLFGYVQTDQTRCRQ